MMRFDRMRGFLLSFLLALLPLQAEALEAPAGQVVLNTASVLRGHFMEERQQDPTQQPLRMSGHFVVAPAHGLIWGVEKPFPTSTIITPNSAVQDIGGLMINLPAKNLRHIFEMVGGALAGNWNALGEDFMITASGNSAHWQMLMTPRHDGKAHMNYATITVSGNRFVDAILLTKADGSTDMFSFTDEALSAAPLQPLELATFAKTGG